jgi:hypothetical protein
MTDTNVLNLASASDIKALVTAGTVTHADAIARCDVVLTRKVLTDGKRARWTRLREWIVKSQTEAA